MGSEPQPDRPSPFLALQSANYRLFISGFLCSSLGLQMLNTAILWEIYQRTHDEYAVGLAGLVRALPVVAMALPAGWAVDHFDRRRVLSMTQIAFAFMANLLAIASFHDVSVNLMYVILFVMGCVRSFNGPSRSSLLPDIVPPGAFANAVTWTTGVFHFSAAAGPILAGLLIWCAGEKAWPVYSVTACGCMVLGVTANMMSVTPMHNVRQVGRVSLRDMFAGAGHVWREKTVLATITLDLFAVLLGGVTALLPAYCEKILYTDERGYGLLRAAMPIGAVVMSVILAHLPPMRRAGRMLLWSVAGYGACTIAFGFSEVYVISLVALLIAGAFDSVSVVIRHVLVQTRTPASLRGRVSAVNSVFIECSNELGSYESGLVAGWFGPMASAVSGGIGTVLVVVGVTMAFPAMRSLDRLEEPVNDPPSPRPPAGPPQPDAGDVPSEADINRTAAE